MNGHSHDLRFASDMREALLREHDRAPRYLLMLIAALLAAAFAWASTSRVEEITKGPARIVPSSRQQVMQSLEGGLLQELLVVEGQVVGKGQALLRIDPTRADAAWREGQSRRLALRAAAARLQAESSGNALAFPPEVASVPDLVRNESRTYLAKRRTLEESTHALLRGVELLSREIEMTQPMAERGLVAEVDLLRMRRQLNDLQMQIAERRNRYRAEAAAELTRVSSELEQVTGLLGARLDQVERTIVRAPVRGTVTNIRVTTIGGVIQPGQDIMSIVPLDDQLLVEAKIAPHEVAFLRPGLPATVKLSAYDYSTYGTLSGEVELVSADTLQEEEQRSTAENYYKVLVRTKGSTLGKPGSDLPIIPGMTGSVEIRTGDKSVLDYLLKPISRAREALRER